MTHSGALALTRCLILLAWHLTCVAWHLTRSGLILEPYPNPDSDTTPSLTLTLTCQLRRIKLDDTRFVCTLVKAGFRVRGSDRVESWGRGSDRVGSWVRVSDRVGAGPSWSCGSNGVQTLPHISYVHCHPNADAFAGRSYVVRFASGNGHITGGATYPYL